MASRSRSGSGLNPAAMAGAPLTHTIADAPGAAALNNATEQIIAPPRADEHATDRRSTPTPLIVPANERRDNPFGAIFGAPIFRPADKDTLYVNERDGSKSRKVADILLPLAQTGGFLPASIYLKQSKGAAKALAEFSWTGRGAGVICQSAAAKVHMDEFKHGMVALYVAWSATAGPTYTRSSTGIETDFSL